MNDLMYEIARGNDEKVTILLENKFNIHECDKEGHDVFWYIQNTNANKKIRMAIVKAFISEKKINFQHNLSKKELIIYLEEKIYQISYPIFITVEDKNEYQRFIELIKLHEEYQYFIKLITCLKHNYFINKFIKAISTNNICEFEKLLASGFNINTNLNDKCNLLHIVATYGKDNFIAVLNRYGINLKLKNEDGWTALHFAIENGHNKTAAILIDLAYSLVNETNSQKQAPLHFAVINKNIELINLLLDLQANINQQDNEGCTPLHYAMLYQPQVAQLLIDRGANLMLRNKRGFTAQEYPSNFLNSENRYKINNSLLMATKLLERLIDKSKMLCPAPGLFLDKNNMRIFTMQDLANKVCSIFNWSETKRAFEYIAIGVRKDGRCIVTTNHHAPVVFRLEDVTASREHFNSLYKLRDNYNKKFSQNYSFVKGKTRIHPETLLAALKEHLKVEYIFLTNAGNQQTGSCIFCANYLLNQYYFSYFHIRKIRNYCLPSQADINNVISWLEYIELEIPMPISYEFLGPYNNDLYCEFSIKIQENSLMTQQETINYIIKNYQALEIERNNTVISAQKLAEANSFSITKKKMTAPLYNRKLTFFNDGHLLLNTKGKIESVNPTSPRSIELSTRLNKWLDYGFNSKISINDNIIELTREGVSQDDVLRSSINLTPSS